ncbi:LpqB family beta-propeller domain-containing protein [Natronobiforma cellulositropha]|uniref:LpqB family beta-propeller domain-containing protein n=1 Tax=Natronobiforma cellulositropha TaxID=1679076 RepID=UPI003CCD505C
MPVDRARLEERRLECVEFSRDGVRLVVVGADADAHQVVVVVVTQAVPGAKRPLH